MSILVHPKSQLTAQQLVGAITQDPHIQMRKYSKANLKNAFWSKSKTELDVRPFSYLYLPKIARKEVKPWYLFLHLAASSNHWYITTGEWLSKGVVRAHAGCSRLKYLRPEKQPSPVPSPAPGAQAPKRMDFGKDAGKKTQRSHPTDGIAATKKGKLDVSGEKLDSGCIVTLNHVAVGGVCIPPKAWAKKDMQYYDENGRGIIVIPMKCSGAFSGCADLQQVARKSRGKTILHELLHAGIAENKRDWTGHCFDAFVKFSLFFKSLERQTCCDEIRRNPSSGARKRALTKFGCSAAKVNLLGKDPIDDLFRNE